jgi:hypothetical protein
LAISLLCWAALFGVLAIAAAAYLAFQFFW